METGTVPEQCEADLSSDVQKHRKCLDEIIAYLERLGVCIAALFGSGAVFQFRNELFATASWLPATVGILGIVGSMVLVVWVSADAFSRISTARSKIVSTAVALLVLLPSVFFVLAGLYALSGIAA